MGLGDILSRFFKKENGKETKKEIKREISIDEEKKKEFPLAQDRDEFSEPMSKEDLESSPELFKEEIYTETMANIYLSQGLYERAIRVFEKLLEQEPENQSFQIKLGQAKAYLLSEKAGFQTKR